jgi:methanethiol S-methyltransferase
VVRIEGIPQLAEKLRAKRQSPGDPRNAPARAARKHHAERPAGVSSGFNFERRIKMIKRIVTFGYGAVSYLAFFVTFLYAIGFIGNFIVPKSMDSASTDPWTRALLIDIGLLSAFAIQHSVMARSGFKRLLTRVVPVEAERSTYVLASSLALILLFWQWRPLGGRIWEVQNGVGLVLLYAGYAFGLLLVLGSTVVINHFDLFGLRQVWRNLMGQPQSELRFVTPTLYRVVRHPLYVGWLFSFWCTPSMTVTHLLFAVVTTSYILFAIQLEERDLMNKHPEYAEYRRQVPMLVPSLSRPSATAPIGARGAQAPTLPAPPGSPRSQGTAAAASPQSTIQPVQ